MEVKVLLPGAACDIVAVMDGAHCPAEMFIQDGEESTRASREGLFALLEHVANHGLQGVPTAWVHEANKKEQIYEFRKGSLRLLFFKGRGRQVAVCTSGVHKKTRKADPGAVSSAARWRRQYQQAVDANTLKVVE
jgi:hypothetical protein